MQRGKHSDSCSMYMYSLSFSQCGYESAREDIFLDIPLVIKPFGRSETYGSVEEAMQAFVEPETLEGDNQVDTNNK